MYSWLFSDKRYPRSLGLLAALFSAFIFTGINAAYASGGDDFTDRIKVAFTYKIIQFIEWTEDAGDASKSPVIICVLADKQLDRLFADFEEKEINGRSVQILFLEQPPKSSDLCGVLYIGSLEQTRLPQILQQIESQGKILTVSDIEQFAKSGGMVELKVHGRSVKMEVNVSSATNVGIRISSKLLEVANVVQRD